MPPEDNYDARAEIQELHANFHQPDKFAKTFIEAARTQKSIDKELRKIIKNLIKTDQDTIDTIKSFQRQVDKEDWRFFIKKIGLIGLGFISLGTSTIAVLIIQILTKKFLGIHIA